MFRTFQTKLDTSGNGSVDVSPFIANKEWDIYQISVQTDTFIASCVCELLHNGFFLCVSPQGAMDTATGPPDIVVGPGDILTAKWFNGHPNDLATVGFWYNENDTGTTISFTH